MCSVSIIAIFQSLFRTVIILTARYVMRITKITWNTWKETTRIKSAQRSKKVHLQRSTTSLRSWLNNKSGSRDGQKSPCRLITTNQNSTWKRIPCFQWYPLLMRQFLKRNKCNRQDSPTSKLFQRPSAIIKMKAMSGWRMKNQNSLSSSCTKVLTILLQDLTFLKLAPSSISKDRYNKSKKRRSFVSLLKN